MEKEWDLGELSHDLHGAQAPPQCSGLSSLHQGQP